MDKPIFDLEGKRVWIAGSRGLVGASCLKRFAMERCEIIHDPHRTDLDLRDLNKTKQFVGDVKPDVIVMAAAKVGGILDNAQNPSDFFNDNLQIQDSILDAAVEHNVRKLVFLGSSCVYPRDCPQPIKEEFLSTGALEETNAAYAQAKIAGLEKVKKLYTKGHDFLSLMPCNLYGENDHFDDAIRAHVIPALMSKFLHADDDEVEIWGTGKALREFMHVDDLSDAIVFMLQHHTGGEHINVGTQHEISIANLAKMIAKIAGFKGDIRYNTSKPDGTPRKILDCAKLYTLGWRPKISLQAGLESVWQQVSCRG